jgi:hypothetical protein
MAKEAVLEERVQEILAIFEKQRIRREVFMCMFVLVWRGKKEICSSLF